MNFYLYIIIAPICFASGYTLLKFWATQEKWWLMLIGLSFFVIGNFFVAHAIKLSSLVGTISVIPLASLTLTLLVGFFYFGERISTIQYFGLAFAVVAITLLVLPFQVFSK
ncbi:MAG: hypothetical protein V2A63_03635 [Patescibacteria group bacterium]